MSDKITKFVQSLDGKTRERLKKKLLELKCDPYAVSGVKKMNGKNHTYRLRVGKIRIIYTLDSRNVIEIIDIDYRGNIY
ncbi:type II toxin-antitoxin system RelE/ParE family toxin [Candidatus Uhrbacteria bacterium]|nr:type II toxin-antitoxin system RelE/ParE family toxin [Candidatus Uhrbacteria bacterium]